MTATRSFTEAECRHFLRYTRSRSWPMLQRFPVGEEMHADLLAQMLSSRPQTIRRLIGSLREETRATAARMLADDAFRAAVAALPFGPGERIVAVGDSITADRLGWFELLAAATAAAGPHGPTMVNLGISGNTTADVLERFDLLEAAEPSRVLLMLGTNDARAHGRRSSYRMATTHETERNLRALVGLVTDDLKAPVTVITPPAVEQSRIDAFFGDAPLRWQAAEVAEVAGAVRRAAPDAIDLHEVTRGRPELLESDGVHPSPAGQRFLLTRIVDGLTMRRQGSAT